MDLVEIRITAPDSDVADAIARALVEDRLAACVQQLPAMTSTYRWEGRVERSTEILLLAKARAEAFDEVCAKVTSLHPYEVPEILAVPIDQGLDAYRDWVAEETDGE